MPFQDDDGRMTIFPPGSNLPMQPARNPIGHPAASADFGWLRTGPLDRCEGRRRARALQEQVGGLEIITAHHRASLTEEQARQDLAHAYQQRELLPLKISVERQEIEAERLQGQIALDETLRQYQQEAELAALNHKIEMTKKEATLIAVKACKKEAKRALKEAGKKKEAPAPTAELPEEFRRAWATEQRVRDNRSAADQRIHEIYARAAAERRQLTPDEIEERDALGDSAYAAEAEVRRRSASGF